MLPRPLRASRDKAKEQTMKFPQVLIADDDPFIQKTLKFCLEEAGYSVELAQNGWEAIAAAQTLRPSIVLLDVFMPDCDGLEALLEIKRKVPEAKIFVMSGGGAKQRYDYLDMAMKFGAEGVIRKPLSPSALVEMVTRRPVVDALPRAATTKR
jgi:two-component system, chemotaxis family, chemotaxis protein CheY